jgi:hypothetical protein
VAKTKTGQYLWLLGFVIFAAYAVAWIPNVFDPQILVVGLTGNMREFDSNLWRANQHRRDMIVNLITSGRLNGLTHGQVDALLGPQQPPASKQLEDLGAEGWGIDIGGDYWLMIFYDEHGLVRKVRMKYHGS